ncbi:MAG: type IV toxin-antitoxin system AbiEi family antitoxin [Nitriliruptorales bacterium]|nr:type IV toxin-antitoxin system AbiEi family antitoxin [Nitriliruptorales bacterium]
MHDAKHDNRLFSPTKGLYVLVPPEYRSWGAVPGDWFIDDMMRHLGHPYYVGLLTAAARHGARHQAAQVFQVVSSARIRDRDFGGLRLRFYRASDLAERPVVEQVGPTGRIVVASPETCVLDLAERPGEAGGIQTVVELLAELTVDTGALIEAAASRPRSVIRRTGWLLEHTGPDRKLEALRALARPGEGDPTPLVPGGSRRGRSDQRWGVLVNTQLEPEL